MLLRTSIRSLSQTASWNSRKGSPRTNLCCCLQVTAGHGFSGRHIVLNVERGASVNLYADQNRTILAYMDVPYINMHTSSWFVMNWGLADLGPKFDPLNIHARCTRAATAAIAAGSPRKHLKLPRLLHLVPDNHSRRERRRRVFRRLRNFITRGMCIGGDLPDNLRSRSTVTRTATIQTSNQVGACSQHTQHEAHTVKFRSVSNRSTVDRSDRLWSETLTAANTKSTLVEEEEEREEGSTDDSDEEHTARGKAVFRARSHSHSRSITGALQEGDIEAIKATKRSSNSRAIDGSVHGSVAAEVALHGRDGAPQVVCSQRNARTENIPWISQQERLQRFVPQLCMPISIYSFTVLLSQRTVSRIGTQPSTCMISHA